MKIKSGMEGKAVHADPNSGPDFGTDAICIGYKRSCYNQYYDLRHGQSDTNNKSSPFEIPSGASSVFFTGDSSFSIKDVEVFRV